MSKHASYMKTSSQMGQDKSEIPKSSTSSDHNYLGVGVSDVIGGL